MTEERREILQEDIMNGEKAKYALEFLKEFILEHRARMLDKIEKEAFEAPDDLLRGYAIDLHILRFFEATAGAVIQRAEIAEEELINADE